jgi:FixJ family two-component response regulator
MAKKKSISEGDAFARGEDDPESAAAAAEVQKRLRDRLTPRQAEILSLLLEERTPREIASRFGIDGKTVEREVAAIQQAMQDVTGG